MKTMLKSACAHVVAAQSQWSQSQSQSLSASHTVSQTVSDTQSVSVSHSLVNPDCQPDADNPDCTKVTKDTITLERSCKWHILKRDLTVHIPSILEVDVETSCPVMKYGDMHVEMCNECGKLHKPCEDQFATCDGCCGTRWHDPLGTQYQVPSSHSCDALKSYYLIKNSLVCPMGGEDDPDVGAFTLVLDDKRDDSPIWKSGKLNSTCWTAVKELRRNSVPVKLKFECNSCNAGVPDLLEQCCDKCMEFAASEEARNLQEDGTKIVPYVWCSGCNTTTVRSVTGEQYPFPQHERYANRTEDAADLNMTKWVEDNVCEQFEHTCAKSQTAPTTTTTTKVELFMGSNTHGFDNGWMCWTSGSCSTYSGTSTGKRDAYDSLPLEGVAFACTDSSNTLKWEVRYDLTENYQGRTLLDIVSTCLALANGVTDSSVYGWGLCRHVGELKTFQGTTYSQPAGDEFAIGRGDMSSDDNDWIVFSFSDTYSSRYTYDHDFMGMAGISDLAMYSCWGPGGGAYGRMYIYGYEFTTTTTTTTQCLDRCTYLRQEEERKNTPIVDFDDRRLEQDGARQLSDKLSVCGNAFDIQAFYEKFESLDPQQIVDDAVEIEAQVANATNFSVTDESVPTVMVAAVLISDLEEWTDATMATLRTGVRAGFAYALDVPAKDLQITLHFNDQTETVTAMANATEDVAMTCDAFFPLEQQVEIMLRATMPTRLSRQVKVRAARTTTTTTTATPGMGDTVVNNSVFLSTTVVEETEEITTDLASRFTSGLGGSLVLAVAFFATLG